MTRKSSLLLADRLTTAEPRFAKGSAIPRNLIEHLERRVLLASDTRWPLLVEYGPVIELAPETIDPKTGISPPSNRLVPDPANIVWVNRGLASDGFAATFGTSANLARSVVDAVIVRYEEMIGSFDYPLANQTYSLTLSMGASGGGFGASASLQTSQGGKPKSGSITMGAGNGSANANDDNGWFLDPTPFENSEFIGNITNAFAGDAQGGSPALGRGDFFTVVAAEMTHCMGLFGNSLSGWANRTSNTGINDTVTGVGQYWVFQGPSIEHLGTSDNAGVQNFFAYIHSAEGASSIFFSGKTWNGAEDQGNAFYENSRRYLINNVFSLMFKDAYGYLSTNPAQSGTFYCVLNETTGNLLVRGGAGTSADSVVIQLNGGQLQVSVDVGNDIPGTGALAGAGNLPAFVSLFDVADVSSITVDLGDGGDILNVLALPNGINLTANMGAGNDIINVGGNDFDSNILANVSINAGSGTDVMQISDSADNVGDDTYTLSSSNFTKTSFVDIFSYSLVESITLNANPFNNTINVTSLSSATNTVTANGGDGNDTFNIANGDFDSTIFASLICNGGNGTDLLVIDDSTDTVDDSYTVTASVFSKSSTTETVTFFTMEGLTLTASNANNTINVNAATAISTLVVNGSDGNDTINLGSGDLDSDLAFCAITVNGGLGTDTLYLNDLLDAGADSYTINSTSVDKNTAGIEPPIAFATMENVTLDANPDNNTITIENFSSTLTLLVNGNGGNDTFQQGPTDMNTNWVGNLTLNGNAGTDTINLDDSGDTTAAAYTITSTTFAVTAGILAGPFFYGTIENFNWTTNTQSTAINVSSTASGVSYVINASSGADTINVASHASTASLTVNGGNDNDVFNIGTPGDNVETVDGGITINGDAGSDTLNYNDATNSFNDIYIVTSSTLTRTASGTVTYGTVESVKVNAGTGNNSINISSTLAGTSVTVNGGNGDDSFNVGSPANNTDPVDGFLTLNGDAGTDALNYNDSSNAVATTYTLQSTTIARTGAATTSYQTMESLVVNAGTGSDTIQMNSSIGGPVFVNAGPGADAIHITGNFSGTLINVDGGTGLEVVTVNNDSSGSAGLRFNNTQDLASLTVFPGGRVEVAAGGNKVIETDALSITGNGVLDLFDNDMIVDYAGASQLAVVQALINSGRAGGVWTGSGITSTSAKNAVPRNTTLGALEASQYKSIYGPAATFDGRTIDNTAVLVKYTWYGDTDFNGVVNFDDYARTDAGFSQNRTGWLNGDFDGNGVVNFDDYALIDLAFNTQSGTLRPAGGFPLPGSENVGKPGSLAMR